MNLTFNLLKQETVDNLSVTEGKLLKRKRKDVKRPTEKGAENKSAAVEK